MKRVVMFLLALLLCNLAKGEEKNRIIVCENSLEMLSWDFEFIRHAKYSLDISACFFGGKTARDLLAEIEARLETCPTLQVSILSTPFLIEAQDYVIIERLRKRFPRNFRIVQAQSVATFWPDISGIDNHIKVLVVDEQYFSMGGTNLEQSQCADGTYPLPRNGNKSHSIGNQMPSAHRDQDIVGRGEMAKELRQTFCKIFTLWEHYNKTYFLEKDPEHFKDNPYYFEIPDKPYVASFENAPEAISLKEGQMRLVLAGPHQKRNKITETYVQLINEAKTEIKIANIYMCPADEIFKALLAAVNRGIKLTVLTNGVHELSPHYCAYFCWANRMSYVPFFHGQTYRLWDVVAVKNSKPKSTRIYEYYVEDVLLHKKIMIVDDHLFAIGSYNLGTKSHLSDYESLMVIESPEVVKAANKVYERDLTFSKEVKNEEAIYWYFDPVISFKAEFQKRFHGLI